MNHPPIQRRHQVVTFCSWNELIRPHKLSIFVAHAEQDFVVATVTVVVLADSNDRLEKQLEAFFFNGARNSRYPFHLFMTKRCITVFVEVNLITSHVFG